VSEVQRLSLSIWEACNATPYRTWLKTICLPEGDRNCSAQFPTGSWALYGENGDPVPHYQAPEEAACCAAVVAVFEGTFFPRTCKDHLFVMKQAMTWAVATHASMFCYGQEPYPMRVCCLDSGFAIADKPFLSSFELFGFNMTSFCAHNPALCIHCVVRPPMCC
jgi:hypothetical protein